MPDPISRAEAARQLLLRHEAKKSLDAYVRYMDLGFVPAKHHRLMLSKLEQVLEGNIPRLALFLPPGSAKSTYGSIVFPAHYLGRFPTRSVLATSHTQELADRFGRRVRNLFSQPEHIALFGVGIARDSQAASHWSTDQDGEYFAAGVGVAISGRRADLGIIDDPVRGREEADSPRAQERTWDWYINDFLPRLKPNAAQVLISTRWNERDLAGRILEREASLWDIVEIPMEARENDPIGREPGEILWKEWFTADMIETARRDARTWSALYQQSPVAEEGDFFKLAWFTDYDQIPNNAYYYGASDFATVEGAGDYTEHGVFALDTFGNIYVVDWWRGQTTPDVWIEKLIDFMRDYDVMTWFGESGVIRRSIEPYLALRMTQRNTPCHLEWLPSIDKKEVRARIFRALASNGKVWLPKMARFKAEWLQQLTHFPAGRYDDAVDVCSLIGRGLEHIQAPKIRRWKNASAAISHLVEAEHAWLSN